ncbi:RIFT barrel domain-containing protein [Elioraea rosea]|uniref:RIFT barrel domain-containing protein n=1 Tax=Elioraea rosea TaxID=2492390 RepID=UPI001185B514|nr:hypothetical protein [Elioraea rosea]
MTDDSSAALPWLSRRAATRLALTGLVSGCAGAPAWAQQGAVVTPALPCLGHPDDIVSLLLEGSGAPAETVAVFGQAFRQGDLPRGASLTARRATGQALPVQADVTTRHPDGSARFAVVSLSCPALRSGERLGVVLARGRASEAAALDVTAAAAGRSAVVEITPADGGAPWRADLLLRMQDAVVQRLPKAAWQAGHLAVQARVRLPVPAEAVGGAASARLVADLALRADGTLWCAVWLRNDIAMRAQGGTARYTLRLLLDGREVLDSGEIRQFQYQGFGRTRSVAPGGAASTPPFVRHDVHYLAEIGAVPHYDVAVGVADTLLGRLAAATASREWAVPLAPRGIAQYMPATGGRGDIGPTTMWQAAWLVSMDRRAAAYVLGQAEAAGAVPWHFWDDANDTWLSTEHYPALWTDPRGGTGRVGNRASGGLAQQRAPTAETGWTPDIAHQPDLSTVPYLLTGERWILDNLQAQTSAAIMGTYPVNRLDGEALVTNGGQVRGSAWNLRQVGNAAWLSPDGSAEKAYFESVQQKNWSWLVAQTPGWTAKQGEAHGWVPGVYGERGGVAPWQQDYFASTTLAEARRGNADALAFLRWQANFLLGRFQAERAGLAMHAGAGYGLAVTEATTFNPISQRLYPTWAEIAQANEARGWAKRPWSDFQYNQLALATLAGLATTLRSEDAARLFATLSQQRMRGTSIADYRQNSTYAIVPPGFSRAGSAAPRCTPSRPPG